MYKNHIFQPNLPRLIMKRGLSSWKQVLTSLVYFFSGSLSWVQLTDASGMIGTRLRSGSNGRTSDEAEIAKTSVFTVGKESEIAGTSVYSVENECDVAMRSFEHGRQQQVPCRLWMPLNQFLHDGNCSVKIHRY